MTSAPLTLQRSLNELHKKNIEWESNLELWKHELVFFRKLLQKYGRRINQQVDIEERDHFNFLLSYYSGDLMDSLSSKITAHELRLKTFIKNKNRQDETAYRSEHDTINKEITIVEHELRCYKNELYHLIEKVIHNHQ